MEREDLAHASEDHCDRLGDLAARSGERQQLDLREWAAIAQALWGRPGWRPRRWLVVVLPALAGLALWIAAGQHPGWNLQGCIQATDGSLSVPDYREGVVSFTDGTRITLGKSSRAEVRPLGFWRGAQLALHSGHADLSVVHRFGRRWEVVAGPFEVRVTGTRFEVDWAPARGRFSLRVSHGEVIVSGGPLPTSTPVRTGQRLDVDTAAAYVLAGDLAAIREPVTPTPARAVPAKVPARTVAEAGTPAYPADRTRRKRGVANSKTMPRDSLAVAQTEMAEAPAGTPAAQIEPPLAAPASDAWSATRAAEDEAPPAAPGPYRLTVAANGALEGGATGPVIIAAGSETRFSSPAIDRPERLYLDGGTLCTRGTIYALTCVNEQIPTMWCDWKTNWGVAINWYPRPDREAWGSSAASGIAMEFRGRRGPYRLIAHRAGDPPAKVYCLEDYRSGHAVTPAQLKSECWHNAGSTLPDFTEIEFFALQVPSEQTARTFQYCLSGVSLF